MEEKAKVEMNPGETEGSYEDVILVPAPAPECGLTCFVCTGGTQQKVKDEAAAAPTTAA